MKDFTTRDLREPLTLLLPQILDDGEGGWREEWKSTRRLWASIWPLIQTQPQDKPSYRIIIRAGINLPLRIAFLWHLYNHSKRLVVESPPMPIQYNRFLSMIAKEEQDA